MLNNYPTEEGSWSENNPRKECGCHGKMGVFTGGAKSRDVR